MKETVSRKYLFNKDDKQDLILMGKRIFKLILIVILIKSTRLMLLKSESANTVVSEIFALSDPEQIFKFFAISMMYVGIICLIGGYIWKGKAIIQSRIFIYLFFFCIIDAAFIYIFPEIPAAVAKTILLK